MRYNHVPLFISGLFLITALSFFGVEPAYADQLYSAVEQPDSKGLGRYSQFVLATLLRDMGLDLDEKDRDNGDGGKEEKKKEREEEREKKDKQDREDQAREDQNSDDDFFSDDGFFDSDKGFEDIANGFEKEYQDTTSAWDKEYEETVKRWNKAKTVYEKEKKTLVKAAYDMNRFDEDRLSASPESTGARRVNIESMQAGEYHVIPYALDADIRNQGGRGTCASFAGIRAIETVLRQHSSMRQSRVDLSEQHFFWLSRDDCKQAPCTIEKDGGGSLFDIGFLASQKNGPQLALKLEMHCPYSPYENKDNISYTPLADCNSKRGFFSVEKFNPWLRIEDVVNELAANRPVAAGFKLTPSFMDTKGLVRWKDPANAKAATGRHAAGHAVLLVGFIKLPEHLWHDEGKYGLIMVNSWGVGYGVGGHACLTERWVQENCYQSTKNPERGMFTSVETVRSYL